MFKSFETATTCIVTRKALLVVNKTCERCLYFIQEYKTESPCVYAAFFAMSSVYREIMPFQSYF